jgi:hypothetical protein
MAAQDRTCLGLGAAAFQRRTECCFHALKVGDDANAWFWTDAWLPEEAIRTFAPSLFAAVGRRRLKRTVKDALRNRRWVRDIIGACTSAVINEYIHV